MTYTDLYTSIDTVIASVLPTRYYTVIPSPCVYPHILTSLVSDNPMPHNDSHMPAVVRVQIEVRAVDQSVAVAKGELITTAMRAKSESDSDGFYARPQSTPRPLVYDADARVYRVIQEYLIHYK